MQQMQNQMQAMTMEIQRLSQENQRITGEQHNALQQQQQQSLQALQAVAQALTRDNRGPTLVDNKGLGKPAIFPNKQPEFLRWSRSVENFAVSNFGETFRGVMEWAAMSEVPIDDDMVQGAYGDLAEAADAIPDIDFKLSQLYLALVSLTEEESQDLVVGAGPGHGAEAWRRLFKRWDPIVAGRRRALLKQIISPERCRLDELVGCWERWEQLIRRYEKQRDSEGRHQVIPRDIKMTAFEMMLPPELENHLVLNRSRINSYELQREEVQSILDAQIGGKIRELQIKPARSHRADDNAMDVDAFAKGGKGGGGGRGGGDSSSSAARFEGECYACGRYGHRGRDCWFGSAQSGNWQGSWSGGSGAGAGKGGSSSASSTGTGKGKGFFSAPKGSPGKDGKKGKGKETFKGKKGKGKETYKGKKGKGRHGGSVSALDDVGSETPWEQWAVDHWSETWNADQSGGGVERSWDSEGQWPQHEPWGETPSSSHPQPSLQQSASPELRSFDLGSLDESLLGHEADLERSSEGSGLEQSNQNERCDLCAVDDVRWVRMNYDTGAATTAFPKEFAGGSGGLSGNGQCYRGAGGELIMDEGGLKMTAETERGDLARLTGRIADVHKTLVSASKSASLGQNGWITKHGGWLIPDGSAISHKIKKLLDREAAKSDHRMIPMYEENGVYNFYVKLGGSGSKVEVDEGSLERTARTPPKVEDAVPQPGFQGRRKA